MIAYRRADIRELNDAAHALMLRANRLSPEALVLGEREFRVGDLRPLPPKRPTAWAAQRHPSHDHQPRANFPHAAAPTMARSERRPSRTRRSISKLGYALTGHSVQGATVDRAFVLVEDWGAQQEYGYVACSRARGETRLYLATPPLDPDLPASAPERGRIPERVVQALSVSSSEPLATDQADRDPATTERVLAIRQHQLELQRARAKQRLAAAEAELDRLGWRGRRKHGAKLRAEINFQRMALRLADKNSPDPPSP